jgi:uncharacterized membrane protein
MRRTTYFILLCALTLALGSIPLLFVFTPIGLACCIGGLLLAVLAIPGLNSQEPS